VRLKMLYQLLDPSAKEGNLHYRRTGIAFVDLELL